MRSQQLYEKMAELSREGVSFVLATIIASSGSSPRKPGTKMLVLGDGTTFETIGGGALEKQVRADALACLSTGVSRTERYVLRPQGEDSLGTVCGGEASVFLEVNAPDRTLLIVGAGHISQKLAPLAKLLDFRVVVVDPREELLTPECFPQADELLLAEASQTAALVPITETTHIVIVTHSHIHDLEALRSVLPSVAAYVGMMGSAAKVRTVFAQLTEEGIDPARLARVHAPIGLDIGAQTPAELALCVMAEIVGEAGGGGKGAEPKPMPGNHDDGDSERPMTTVVDQRIQGGSE